MSTTGKRTSAAAVYRAVADKRRLLYHVAHARKENSTADYDGEELLRLSSEHVEGDITRLRDAAKLFRDRSIARP